MSEGGDGGLGRGRHPVQIKGPSASAQRLRRFIVSRTLISVTAFKLVGGHTSAGAVAFLLYFKKIFHSRTNERSYRYKIARLIIETNATKLI